MSLLTEYIDRNMSVPDLEKELMELIRQYNKSRDTYLFVYASALTKRIPLIAIDQDDYYTINDLLRYKKIPRLDFYIETPGGSAEAVEEIVRCLRKKCETISFVVSGEAKSAGTILVLSGDEILMTESGSLGPIDAQVRIGRSQVSAHDYLEWVREKHTEAKLEGELNPFDATMIAQITPGELKGVNQSLKFAEDLVKEWLPKYKFKNWTVTETRKEPVTEQRKTDRAVEIARELSNHTRWRSHGRSIKIEDLEQIGLKIGRIDDDTALRDIVYRIQMVCKLLFETTTIFKIFATQERKLFRHAAQIQQGPSLPAGTKAVEVVELKVVCPKCGKEYDLFAKFVDKPRIDKDFQAMGARIFPPDGKLICDCGFTLDLTGVKNQIEVQVGKKIIS
jgi:hypothetical protein